MQWSSSVSERPDLEGAVSEAAAEVRAQLGDAAPELLFAFPSEEHAAGFGSLPALLRAQFPGALLLGCSAHSVIGAGRELEDGPGLALTAACLPGVSLHPFHLDPRDIATLAEVPDHWRTLVGVDPREAPPFVLLGDPFSGDAETLAASLDECFAASVKIGGLASGGEEPGETALFLGDEVHRSGFVGLALAGDIACEAVVAQGCRPVGNPMFVTHCRGNVLFDVDGRPPLEVLNELFAQASADDQELFRSSLFLGLEMRSDQTEYHQGDFLIRNLVGGDPDSGALSIAAELHETQVVQFHLRDGRTAAIDLEEHLAGVDAGPAPPRGALLFSCLGRGRSLYGVADHDSRLFREHLGAVPLTGFFCNGEIGPVQHRTFLHGYTSAFGIFRPKRALS